jgi:methionyl aminopeptidase
VIVRKSEREIELIGAAGRIAADTIAHVGRHIEPGVTSEELDRIAEEYIRGQGGIPTSKGYRGFPKAICISPNEMIVHGIPGAYVVKDGDLLTIDVGVTLDGYVADTAYTFGVGDVASEDERLLEVAQAALSAGIEQAQVDNRVGDISSAIQRVVEEAGFSVVRALVGHGVGRAYHEDPQIPNYGTPGRGARLSSGMTIAIEPMITAGGVDIVLDDDQWSVYTADGSMSAHFEHTVAVTEAGPRILTPVAAGLPRVSGGLLQ